MADDTLALLAHLGIGRADLFGYSLGAGIALNRMINHPAVVGKAVLASVAYDRTGFHPAMLSPQDIAAIDVPVLLVIGDSDIVTPEHAAAMFRLHGGGVLGDLAPMASSQFAVLPGTSHLGMTGRAAMLMTMIPPFLDAP